MLSQPLQKKNSQWIRSMFWDGIWMVSSLWLFPIVVWLWSTSVLTPFHIFCTFFLWIAHRFCTTYLAFCTPHYRSLVLTNRTRFVGIPLFVISFILISLFLPESILPLSKVNRLLILGSVDLLWNLYHFASQHYGVVSIYRFRTKRSHTVSSRRYEKGYCLIVGGVLIGIAEVFQGGILIDFPELEKWIDQEALVQWFEIVQLMATGLIITMMFGVSYIDYKAKTLSIPKQIYLGNLAFLGIWAFYLDPFPFLFLWTVQHWMVAIGLTYQILDNSPSTPVQEMSMWHRLWNRINQDAWTPILFLCLLSVLFTPMMEVDTVPVEWRYGDQLFPFFSKLLENNHFLTLCVGMGFSTGFIHYHMDRSLFRFSHPRTREVTLPLLMQEVKRG